MNSYPSRNSMLSATNASKEAELLPTSSVVHWFNSYFPVPKTIALSQANPVEAFVGHQVCLFPHPTREFRNNLETVKHKSTKLSPPKAFKSKPPRMKRSKSKNSKNTPTIPETKREKKNPNINIDISSFDVSGVPPPVCSCTGIPKVCYKWGMGGWQSSCCTISISTYPLPMSTTRHGVRLAGRKMSSGAYVKLLMRLAGEGYDLSHPVDLKNHWARHGTNKFVTIK